MVKKLKKVKNKRKTLPRKIAYDPKREYPKLYVGLDKDIVHHPTIKEFHDINFRPIFKAYLTEDDKFNKVHILTQYMMGDGATIEKLKKVTGSEYVHQLMQYMKANGYEIVKHKPHGYKDFLYKIVKKGEIKSVKKHDNQLQQKAIAAFAHLNNKPEETPVNPNQVDKTKDFHDWWNSSSENLKLGYIEAKNKWNSLGQPKAVNAFKQATPTPSVKKAIAYDVASKLKYPTYSEWKEQNPNGDILVFDTIKNKHFEAVDAYINDSQFKKYVDDGGFPSDYHNPDHANMDFENLALTSIHHLYKQGLVKQAQELPSAPPIKDPVRVLKTFDPINKQRLWPEKNITKAEVEKNSNKYFKLQALQDNEKYTNLFYHMIVDQIIAKDKIQLLPEELKAVQSYTGSGYKSLNMELYQNKEIKNSGYLKEMDENMSKAIKKVKESDYDVTVYSGIKVNDPRDLIDETGIFEIPAYMSTSAKYSVAKGFTSYTKHTNENGSTHSREHILEIKIPAGHKFMSVREVSNHTHEHEVILHKKSRIRILKEPTVIHDHSYSDGSRTTQYVWHAELVDDGTNL